jgi:hypothetical protein
MARGRWILGVALAVGGLAWVGGSIRAQSPASPQRDRDQLRQPIYRVAQQGAETPIVANNTAPPRPEAGLPAAEANPQQHPLEPALQMAYAAMTNIRNNIHDYSCTMIKRERIDGKLNDPEYMFIKVKHEPFSVYTYFLAPNRLRGQEAIYVAGQNNGNLLGHGVGLKKIAGTVPLLPTGNMAMQGNRYPITEIGMLNLVKRLVEVAESDKQYGECEVKFYQNAKINTGKEKRNVTVIEVIHPVPRKNFRFHLARVYVDTQLNMPVRYESYDWPDRPGGQPQLLEEYTYTDIKLNNNFTAVDFDTNNPQYNFR